MKTQVYKTWTIVQICWGKIETGKQESKGVVEKGG